MLINGKHILINKNMKNGTDTISRPTIAVCWGAEIRLLYNEDSSIELYSYDCTDMFTF